MLSRNATLWQSLDWATILIYILLVVGGWFSICGATYSIGSDTLFVSGSRPMMQLVWMGLGLLIAFSILLLSPDLFERNALVYYGVMLGLCLITIFVAPDIKGSRSWLVLGPLRLQPAEFTKVATALSVAWVCSRYDFTIRSYSSYAQLFGIILLPVVLILAQSETGSALVFFAIFLALYREGFTGLFMGLGISAVLYFVLALLLDGVLWGEIIRADIFVVSNLISILTLMMLAIYAPRLRSQVLWLALIGMVLQGIGWLVHRYYEPIDLSFVSLGVLGALVVYLLYLWSRRYQIRYILLAGFALGSLGFFYSTNYVFDNILEPHQQVRIKVALGIESDLRGKGYNVDQSKIAIGSGGMWGKGFLEGTQTKLDYVPEQDTDFIFCTVGEEQGFVGSVGLLVLYTIFILRLVHIAERQTRRFARVYGYCIASIFFFHLFVNIGMVLGLVPVIGIPLPFFSYGGSSLWSFTIMLFIYLGMDARRYNKDL